MEVIDLTEKDDGKNIHYQQKNGKNWMLNEMNKKMKLEKIGRKKVYKLKKKSSENRENKPHQFIPVFPVKFPYKK